MNALRAVALVCLFSAAVATLGAPETVEVKAETADLYLEADTTSKVFARVSKGTILAIQETHGAWYRVAAPGSGYGVWVRKLDLEATTATSAMSSGQASSGREAGGVSIEHEGVGCVVAGKFPEFEAKLDPADRVSRAQIDFHAEDDPRWYFVAMKVDNGVYRGILPQPLKETKRIHYYIEATAADMTTSRTQEYVPDVVEGAGICVSRKTVAAVIASASVVVQAVVPGAPAIPAGFSAAGIATTASGGASTEAAGTGAASGGGSGLGALLGGVGALVGITAGVASTTGGGAPSATGHWVGQFTINYQTFKCGGAAGLVMDLVQTGTHVTSNSGLSTNLNSTCQGMPPGATLPQTFSGTVVGDQVTLNNAYTDPGGVFSFDSTWRGLLEGNRLNGTIAGTFSLFPGQPFGTTQATTGTFDMTRR